MTVLDMRQRIALTNVVKLRYQKAKKKDKSKILNELIQNTGYNRSYARRILGTLKVKKTRKYSPRNRVYDASVFYSLRKIWIAADGICGQRLQPFLPEMVRVLERDKELKINKEIRKKLLTISSATIDRMLKATRKSYQLHGRSTTKPGTLLRSTIPVRTFADWNEKVPGFFEVDLVAFCGETVRGDYINGLNLTDVATGWTILEAVMGKAQERIHRAVRRAKERLPFALLGLDSDNGTEFINWILKKYCEENSITFTRIRPYRKNDNCFVEQKNYTTLRRFLGYGRYETYEQLEIIRRILGLVELYVNFFQPVLKLAQKERVGAKVKKKYDKARTPYQRVLESEVLPEEEKQKLTSFYESLKPMEIKREISKLTIKLNKINRYIFHDLTKP